jgi:hypothetical protein
MLDRTTRSSLFGAAAFAVIAMAAAFGIESGPAQEAKLVSPGAADGSYLGYSVAVSGDTALLGVRGANDSAGEARVYTRSGTTWTRQATLTGGDTVINNTFGYSVALQGDTAVVGAIRNDSDRGAAYVFTRSGTTWTQQAKLVATDAQVDDWLGLSVAISGDTIVSGAYGVDAYRGAVFVFRRTGAVWAQEAKLSAADGAESDTLGRSVSISGDAVAVGTEARDTRRGAVYVFRRAGTDWAQEAEFTLPDAAEFDYFGNSVALVGDTLLVGAYGRNGRGAAYVYERTDGVWSQTQELVADDAATSDAFGIAVAMSGGTMVVGAYGKDSSRGAAYVFAAAQPPSGYCLPTKVTAKANVKRPERSTLTASGTLDTGGDAPDFSGAATFDAGGFHLDVPAFVAKGKTLTYAAGGVTLKVTPSKTGSSRATFSLTAVGDLAGKVDRDGALALRFKNGAHDLNGSANLTAGRLGPHCVTSPELCVLGASAVLKGGGKDSLKLTLGFATDGVVPAAGEAMTIAFGDSYGSGLLAGSSFVRKGNTFVRSGKAPGLTRVVVNYAKGTITVAGSGLDLGAFLAGGNAVTVTITRGADTRTAGIRMTHVGRLLRY